MSNCGRSFRSLFWVLALVGLFADLASKHAMWTRFEPGEEGVVIIPGVLTLIHQFGLNRGALFGIGNDQGEMANFIFSIISGLAVVVIIAWTWSRQTARDGVLCAALGLVLAGAMGNLYDRLVHGGVRDFIWFRYGWFDWPVFNVADSCLVCGACLLMVHAFFFQQSPVDRKQTSCVSEQPAV